MRRAGSLTLRKAAPGAPLTLARCVLPPRGETLRALLREAGDVALARWARPMPIREKSDGTPVTEADLASDELIRAGLIHSFPGDALVTEESGGNPGSGPWWAVDPIDGTSSFIEGLAHWGPVVARFVPEGRGCRVDCGALWLPKLSEHYHVETEGRGTAWFNGTPLPNTGENEIPRTVYLPSRFHQHFRLRYPGKTRCLGGTAAHLALVARGCAEAAIVAPGWRAWDTATGLALIAATGGVVARLPDGAPLHAVHHEGDPFVAGSEAAVFRLLSTGTITLLPPLPPESR